MSDTKKKSSYSTLTGFHRAVPIILAAVAVFIGLCFVTQDSGSLGRAISGLLLGLFSWGAYVIPALIALHALFYAADVGAKRALTRVIFSAVAVVSVSSFAHAIRYWGNADTTFNVSEFYKNGREAIGGGAIGGIVGFGIIEIIGSVGVIILAATIVAIYLTYFFSSGKKVIGRIAYGTVKGIVYFCAWVEKGIKKLFGVNRRTEKQAKAAEEKNRALLDDEFFDVDNGIEHLEISELGIVETRDKASMEGHATLRDKVHHKSDASPEDAADMERRARERAKESAAFYADVTASSTDKGFVVEDSFIEKKPKAAGVKTEPTFEKEPSADDIFTADFDPYELAMSEKMASKRSSRSLVDEKPAVREDIPEMTDADAERARRNAEFERRKAMLVSKAAAEKAAEPKIEAKTVEYTTVGSTHTDRTEDEHTTESVVIEKPAEREMPRASEYGTGAGYTPTTERPAPTVTYSTAAKAYSAGEPEIKTESTVSENGARATYRRAAEFATATVEEKKEAAIPSRPTYTSTPTASTAYETVRPTTAAYTDTPKAADDVRSDYGYTTASPKASESGYAPATPSVGYTVTGGTAPSIDFKAEDVPVTDSAKDTAYVTEKYTPDTGYTEPKKSEPKSEYNFTFDDGDDEDVYTPSFAAESGASFGGEFNTAPKAEETAPSFKEYKGASDGGLVFEFDMGKAEEPKTLVTETTVFGEDDEDDYENDDGVIEEVFEEDTSDEEIPPEKQNPKVKEMRDMFPALRESEDTESDVDTADDDAYDEVNEEYTDEDVDEDIPPFDEPVAVRPAPTPAPAKAEKVEKADKPKAKPSFKNYKKPPIDLLGLDEVFDDTEIAQEIRDNTNTIIETLASFNVTASIKGVDRGPRITRYEVVPAKGVKVNQITNLIDNITMNLAAEGIRMEAPIPGKSAIGFEIPNKHPTNVRLRELIECEEFINSKSNTFVCIGKDVAGHPVFGDIGKFPHALVAGATGMGKSVCINSIMISLLYKSRPDQIKFIMIDPKKVEFRMYSGIPHLLIPVITDAKQAAGALMWAVDEMERRYDLIEKLNIRNIEAYNERQANDPSIGEHMPKIVIVIDELNDLMMQVRDPVEGLIMRIAQKARAAGIHLIIGTQRPDVKVITGTIKANINTRISCKVTSVVDSRTILEMAGAEKLLNRGDMLFKPVDKTKPIRVQGAFVSDNEVESIMEFLKSQGEGAQYDEDIIAEVSKAAQKCGNKKGGGADLDDDGDGEDAVGYYNDQKFLDAVELAIRSGKISTSLLQRKMSIGYGKAAKYIDAMEEIGVVSEANGQKPRDVLMSMDQWYDKLSRVDLD